MTLLVILPILIPLAAAVLQILTWRRRRVQRLIAVTGAAALAGTALSLAAMVRGQGVAAVQIGAWPAPFGITLVADLFSALMIVLAGVMGLLVVVYSLAAIDEARESFGFHPLVQVLLAGVCGAFLTGDIFNLYVWYEVMLMASFVLLSLGGERAQMEGAIKYVTLNLMASALFLTAVGILYGASGTLNMADLHGRLPSATGPGLKAALAMLFLVAFGIKAALFPLFFWLPASYHTAPPAVAALFSALLTKVGVYSLIRVFTLIFAAQAAEVQPLLLWLAGLTMVTGVLGAAVQGEFRRILAFHSVSQVGYMFMGLAICTPLALAGSIFFILHHGVVKPTLFLVSDIAGRLQGTTELKAMGGLARARPMVALLFLIPALALAGIPPLSGFGAKLALVMAGITAGHYAIVVAALAVSLLTLYSMTKIWAEAFWKPAPEGLAVDDGRGRCRSGLKAMIIPVALLAGVPVLLGLAAGPLLELALAAAAQLLDPADYVRAVLEGDGR